jgi:hypothetical protein
MGRTRADVDSASFQEIYAIKIYVGGVNTVSRGPAVEAAATRLWRANLLMQAKPIQDYLVVPNQLGLTELPPVTEKYGNS